MKLPILYALLLTTSNVFAQYPPAKETIGGIRKGTPPSKMDISLQLRVNPETGQTNNVLYAEGWVRIVGAVEKLGDTCFRAQTWGNHLYLIKNHPWFQHKTLKVGMPVDCYCVQRWKVLETTAFVSDSVSSGNTTHTETYFREGKVVMYYDFDTPIQSLKEKEEVDQPKSK